MVNSVCILKGYGVGDGGLFDFCKVAYTDFRFFDWEFLDFVYFSGKFIFYNYNNMFSF